MYSIAVDIGGSHLTSVVVNLETKSIVESTKTTAEVDAKASAETILSKWSTCIQSSINKAPKGNTVEGIGMAMPGPFDYEKGIGLFKNVNKFDALFGVDVKTSLSQRLGINNIQFINDAFAFGIGEACVKENENYKKILALTLGTGFGSAFIHNKQVVEIDENLPEGGFLYHVPYKTGIADNYISTRWFEQRANQVFRSTTTGVKPLSDKTKENGKYQALFDQFGKNLATIIAPYVKSFGVEKIIIGGNISKAYDLFGSTLEEYLAEKGVYAKISISDQLENATFIGCAQITANQNA